ncbi:MAG: siderophore ABC transporter substrate-binding protein [Limnochordia bacterium]|jgi:iron complex transport system substrate-binding protein
MSHIRSISLAILVLTLIFGAGSWAVAQERITIEHDLGRAEVVKNPSRVIVFDYGILDMLQELGIEPMGLPKSNLPAYLSHFRAESFADVGTLFEPNFERIYELRPDVIFISTRQQEVYPELSRIAPTVFLAVDNNDYLGSLQAHARLLGELFDREALVEEELAAIEADFAAIGDQVAQEGWNALVIMANDGALSAYGPGSRFNLVYDEFGFIPAASRIVASTHGQTISFEFIPEINPDFLIVIDRGATVGGSVTAQQTLNNPLVRLSDAYQNDRILYLSSPEWYVAAGGLQSTRVMIEDIRKGIK